MTALFWVIALAVFVGSAFESLCEVFCVWAWERWKTAQVRREEEALTEKLRREREGSDWLRLRDKSHP